MIQLNKTVLVVRYTVIESSLVWFSEAESSDHDSKRCDPKQAVLFALLLYYLYVVILNLV